MICRVFVDADCTKEQQLSTTAKRAPCLPWNNGVLKRQLSAEPGDSPRVPPHENLRFPLSLSLETQFSFSRDNRSVQAPGSDLASVSEVDLGTPREQGCAQKVSENRPCDGFVAEGLSIYSLLWVFMGKIEQFLLTKDHSRHLCSKCTLQRIAEALIFHNCVASGSISLSALMSDIAQIGVIIFGGDTM